MAITNSICFKNCNCKKITVTDTSDWDTLVPVDDIATSEFILYDSENEIIETKSFEEYEDSVDFESVINFVDGEYRVVVTYIDKEDAEYIIEDFFYNTCNIKCKVDQIVKDLVSEDDCASCKDDLLKLSLEAFMLYKALCAVILCKNTSEADKYLEWLENKLVNYKCKSC